MEYYVVSSGKKPGIYTNYQEFNDAIGPRYLRPSFGKFDSMNEAQLALHAGCHEYRSFRDILHKLGGTPDTLYIIAEPKRQAAVFTNKQDFEETVTYFEKRGVAVKAMAFGAHQLDAALMFWAKGETPGADNLSLKPYSYVQEIFTRNPLFTKEMEARADTVSDAFLQSLPGRRLQLTKHQMPRRMKGNDHDLKDDSFDAKVFRDDIRAFLVATTNKDKTKFDTDNDAFIGNYTERYLQDFLLAKYAATDVEVFRYGDLFDERKILAIMDKYTTLNADGSRSLRPGVEIDANDISYVDSYFFDQYDIMLHHNGHQALLDIKAAGTANEPSPAWDFLYPEKQVQRYLHAPEKHEATKEFVVAAFCKTNRSAPKDMNTAHDVQLWGVIDMETIAKAPKIKKGAYTPHHTHSRDDNRMLQLSQFTQLTDFVEKFILDGEDRQHRDQIKKGLYKGLDFQSAYKRAHAGEGCNPMEIRLFNAKIGREKLNHLMNQRLKEMMPDIIDAVRVGRQEMMEEHKPCLSGLDVLIQQAEVTPSTRNQRQIVRDDDAR